MPVDIIEALESLRTSHPDLHEFFAALASGKLEGIDVGAEYPEPLADLTGFFEFLALLHDMESQGLVEINGQGIVVARQR